MSSAEAQAKTAVVGVIVRDGKVLLGLREYVKSAPVWTCPGGKHEPGETDHQALVRECAEETGIDDLKIGAFMAEKTSRVGYLVRFYLCTTAQEVTNKEPEKFLEWRWFPSDALPENLAEDRDTGILRAILDQVDVPVSKMNS
jgi:8-oxo-dGTP diphosphatase